MKNKNDFNNDSIENIEKTIAELKKEQAEYERKRNGIIITNKFKLIINAVLNNDKTFDKISSTKDDEIGIVFESMFNSEEFHALFDKFSNDDKINNFRQKKARKAENRKKRNQGKNIEKTDNEISIKEGGAEVVTHETVVRPQASTINGTAPSGLMSHGFNSLEKVEEPAALPKPQTPATNQTVNTTRHVGQFTQTNVTNTFDGIDRLGTRNGTTPPLASRNDNNNYRS